MGRKLYVGNLPYTTTEDELRDLFSQAGAVDTVNVVRDNATGRARGFAFVEMATDADAQKAIEQFNEQPMGGRNLAVNEARPKPQFGGGGGAATAAALVAAAIVVANRAGKTRSTWPGRLVRPGLLFFRAGPSSGSRRFSVKVYSKGARVSQPNYGPGTVTDADAHHTVIDFDNHGLKRFVTTMVALAPSSEPAPEKAKAVRRKKAVKAKIAEI